MNRPFKTYLLILFLPILLSACTSERMASRTHRSIDMTPRLVSEREWTIDIYSFEDARVLEVFPIGHRGSGGRMRADFHEVFLQNSMNLMKSLFGEAHEGKASDSYPIILKVTIQDVRSKSKAMIYAKAVFEISIRFEIIEDQNGKTSTLADIICRERVEGNAGTGLSYHKKAHERANLAINNAFVSARQKLYDEMSSL